MSNREGVDERREAIREIIEKRGWQRINELKKYLKDEYGIDAHRNSIKQDLNALNAGDVTDGEKLNLIVRFKNKLRMIEDMIEMEEDMKTRKQLLDLWRKYSKDYSLVLKRLSRSSKNKVVKEAKDVADGKITVRFEDEKDEDKE